MSSVCDDLRAAILLAAMQGKLTEQLPEDGDAVLLAEQIRSKNSGLVKKKKTTSEVTPNEIPFEIPSNWSWIHTGDVCSIISGTSYSKKDLDSDGVRIFRGGNVLDGGELTSLDDDVFVSKELEDREKQPNKNDVVIVASTGSQKVIGKPCIVSEDTNGQIGAFLRIIRPSKLISPQYFWCYMRSSLYRETISSLAKGTNINNIKNEYILNNVFPLPPMPEQERIVEKVDELMARVADLEKSADALASLKKSFPSDIRDALLRAAMQGKLTEQLPEDGDAGDLLEQIKVEKEKLVVEGKIKKQKPLAPIAEDEIPFEIPENWRWVRLESIISFVGNKSKQIKESEVKEEGTFPVVSQSKEKIIGYHDDKNKVIFVDNPVLVFGDHTALIKYIDFDFIVGADGVKVIKPIIVNPYYLYYSLSYNLIGVSGMGAYSRHYKFIKDKLIPIPPLLEQQRIVAKLKTSIAAIDGVNELIASE